MSAEIEIDPGRYHPLRILRQNACLRQVDIATMAGVSRRTLVSIEHGEYQPQMHTRAKILKAMKIPIEQHYEIFGPLPRKGAAK